MSTLLAIPNVSEGRDAQAIDAVAHALGPGLLDVHRDHDHHRAVFTVAGRPGELAATVLTGARAAFEHVDLRAHEGIHPRVGVVDVAPIVFLEPESRGAACAEALVLADRLGAELGLPVFLYGILAGGRTRAELRRGGPAELDRRVTAGELTPDFGPHRLHQTAGAVLVAARPPLLAFNVELEPPATLEDARAIAARIRESGPDGLPGVRAIGLWLTEGGVAQVSTNVEDHRAVTLADVVAAVAAHARVRGAEVVGLPPRAAFAGFPAAIPIRGARILEDVLAQSGWHV